jgi:hypothetical protein
VYFITGATNAARSQREIIEKKMKMHRDSANETRTKREGSARQRERDVNDRD